MKRQSIPFQAVQKLISIKPLRATPIKVDEDDPWVHLLACLHGHFEFIRVWIRIEI